MRAARLAVAAATLLGHPLYLPLPQPIPAVEAATPTRGFRPRVQETGEAEEYGCLVCHADKRRAFRQGVHSERGVRCHDCHGGNPSSLEAATAHRDDFVGPPHGLTAVRICASCHSDPDEMRQYGLPADQLAELRASRHGQLLFEGGNTDAPGCADCHDPHTTRRKTDVRSATNPLNISATCGVCHEDEALMAPYGIPTDQIREHRGSRHGIALFEEHNDAAPTCVSCHGSHAALPPALGEITNACGRCHRNVRRALDEGPHGAASQAGLLPGCTACHSNHGTERMLPTSIDETCVGCHDPESRAAAIGREIEERAVQAERDLAAAQEAIHELVRAGRRVDETRPGFQTALTDFQQISQVQHSLDVERLEDLGLRLSSISRAIRARAEVAAEERWEHKLILIPIWFLALSVIVLATFRLRRPD